MADSDPLDRGLDDTYGNPEEETLEEDWEDNPILDNAHPIQRRFMEKSIDKYWVWPGRGW